MKRSQICPKCSGRRIWVVESFRVPSETAQGAVLPVVPHQESVGGGFFAISRMTPVGHFDTYVCAGCGYSEMYASDFEDLREDPAKGVRLLDASTAPRGAVPMSALQRSPLRLRVVLASIAAIAGAVVFRTSINTSELTVNIPLVAIGAGAIVIHFRSLGAQLVGRALFWSNFVLGAILCFIGSGSERMSSLGLLLGCGVALVLAERRALAEAADARGFRPAAFAGTIELLMVLALADAQTCLLLGMLGKVTGYPLMFVAAAALVVGFVGLYRLALWGVIITMSTSTLLALAMLLRIFNMDNASTPFGLVFAAQVLAPLPMLYSLATKRELPKANPRVRSAAASVFVVLVMIASLVACLKHGH